MPEPVVHELPMRWADLDSLNHVNNVVYLDYAAEARARLTEDGVVGTDETVAAIGVDFLRPMLLSTSPVRVASTRDGADLVQEIGSVGSDDVYARVTTTFGPPPAIAPAGTSVDPLPMRLRRSDIDQVGVVSTTKVFELFQESRILFLSLALREMTAGRFVVGRVEVAFTRPLTYRPEPLESRAWISRVGRSSVTITSQLSDDAGVVGECRAVLVGFDLQSQRSRPLEDDERQQLEAISLPG